MKKGEAFSQKMQKISGKIQSNRYINSISGGLMLALSVMITGAIFVLIDSINIPVYQEFLVNSGLKTLTSIPAQITTNIISLYAVFGIAYTLVGKFDIDGVPAGLLAIMSFLMITPLGQLQDESMAIPFQWLGAAGFFVAMLIGLLVGRVYVFLIEKKIYIKMPEGVPPTVEKSFGAIIPGIVITALMLIIRGIFQLTPQGNIHEVIYSLIQVPLTNLGGSWPAFLFVTLVGSLLWSLGVHGGVIVYSVMAPVWTTLRLENLQAYQEGAEVLPHVISGGTFVSVVTSLGGSCATIGLAIALLKARSKRYSTLGKLAIIPSFLGINEPLMFGMPLVLNPRFIIPMIVTPFLNACITIALIYANIIPRFRGIGAPQGTPLGINGFIEGGWRVTLLQFCLVGLSFAIYYPFFKKADQEAVEEENEKVFDNDNKVVVMD